MTAPALPSPLIAWPDEGNTGNIGGGGIATTVEGDLHTSANGQVIKNTRVNGDLYIDHNDVTFYFGRVEGTVEIDPTTIGFRIWNAGIGQKSVATEGQGLRGPFIGKRLEIFGSLDGIKGIGSFDLQDSYIHDMYDDGVTHSDGIHIQKGGPYLIQHNTFKCWGYSAGQVFGQNQNVSPYSGDGYMTSCIIMAPLENIHDVTINNNRLRGATSKHIIVGEGIVGKTVSRVHVTNNKIGPDNRDWPQWMPNPTEPAIVERSGNTVIGTGVSAD